MTPEQWENLAMSAGLIFLFPVLPILAFASGYLRGKEAGEYNELKKRCELDQLLLDINRVLDEWCRDQDSDSGGKAVRRIDALLVPHLDVVQIVRQPLQPRLKETTNG